MRKSRFTEAQIVEILKEGEAGVPINDLIRKHVSTPQNPFTETNAADAGIAGI